jgi:tripartite-type tricarboxylate transporter receptor subunit TctC
MRKTALLIGLSAIAFAFAMPAQSADWKPTKPIRIIVPWGAGGSTDQAIRAVQGDLEEALGQKVVVVNQPGGGGAIGTQAVLDAEKDGYTWASGAVQDLGTYKIRGSVNTVVEDWHLYLDSANLTVISVNPSAPIKDFAEFITWMKTKPQQLSVAHAGIPSGGHSTMEALKVATGGDYKGVGYDGGNPAIIATVGGETLATAQLLSEEIEMIRAKKLRPLAAITGNDVQVEGFGAIPSAKKWLPNLRAEPIYFGIWLPKGVPADVVATLDKIWATKIKNSAALKKFADTKGQQVAAYYGAEALKVALPSIYNNGWALWNSGQGKVNPADLGWPKQ